MMKKIMYFVPLFMLLGSVLIIGFLYFIIPDVIINFVMGFWSGIKAPVVFILNIFGTKFKFFDNQTNSNLYNFGFLLGIYFWSSPSSFIAYKSRKKT